MLNVDRKAKGQKKVMDNIEILYVLSIHKSPFLYLIQLNFQSGTKAIRDDHQVRYRSIDSLGLERAHSRRLRLFSFLGSVVL